MVKKETAEGNKLIAQFMGAVWEFQEEIYKSYAWHFEKGKTPTKHSSLWWGTEQLQYHDNWEWLMPVLEKIKELDYPYLISNNTCSIYKVWQHTLASHDHSKTTIEATWKAVVKFIKWHKQQ